MMALSWASLVMLTVITFGGVSCQAPPYEVQTAYRTNSSSSQLQYSTQSGVYNNFTINSYLAVVSNPVGNFHILYPTAPNGTCEGYIYTSKEAARYGCLYATNASPFSMYQLPGRPTCIGYAVSNGSIGLLDPTSNTNFGLTSNGDFVIGVLQPSDVTSMGFVELASGFGWLLRRGELQVSPNSSDLIAPRTAIGTDRSGRLMIFEADGAEDLHKGLTLYQLAQWLLSLGGYNVINLDGGGSSVTYYNGTVVSVPTCRDSAFECQRLVTTITCVMP